MAKLSRIDPVKAAKGTWFDYEDDGIRLLIANIPNQAYEKFLQDRQMSRLKKGKVSTEEREKLIEEAMANTVLLGWENIDDTPYSVEKALSLLRDPELRHFKQFVFGRAIDDENYKKEVLELAAGN